MKKLFLLGVLATLLTGCSSLVPKRVELGQDKVEKMPVAKPSEREVQRQVAQRAAVKADETLRAAIMEDASPVVVTPAAETVVLSDAVSRSLGPPSKPAAKDLASEQLARKLDASVAALNKRIEEFREDNDKNAGHKIEDTGILKVPYFVWLGGAFVLIAIAVVVAGLAWTALKIYGISNPPVGLGIKAVQTGGALAAKAVGQLVGSGEKFKSWLKTELPHVSEDVKKEIEDLFVSAHKETCDEAVQHVAEELTRK